MTFIVHKNSSTMNSPFNAKRFRLKWFISIVLLIFLVKYFLGPHLDSTFFSSTEKNQSSFLANFSFEKLVFSPRKIYHFDGVAFDFYSQNELDRNSAGDQWKIWSIPNENFVVSPSIVSRLAFVEKIFVMTDPRLVDRHRNLRKVFQRQGLSMDFVEWRFKWNETTCNDRSNLPFVSRRLNLKNSTLNSAQKRRCALVMKHVDVWYEMAEKNVSLALILEDDAIFVPFFKEKFTRTIFAALNRRILRFDGRCAKNASIDEDPMFVLGTCYRFHDGSFQSNLANARPMFSAQKRNASRCTHAYLLTSCSAKALVTEIQREKNEFWPADFFQNYLFARSPTLQSFWIDPSLVYQGNQVIDLDHIETFKKQTYL